MKYEVGKFYRVPCVQMLSENRHLGRVGDWRAVLLPQHEDAEIVKFPELHYHLDVRFLPNRYYAEFDVYPYGVAMTEFTPRGLPATSKVEIRRKKCRRRMPSWYPTKRAPWHPELENHYADKVMKDMVCPHRGVDLSACESVNGLVICPAHGLCWNTETGALVKQPNILGTVPGQTISMGLRGERRMWVRYKCKTCLRDERVDVRRRREDEEIKAYLDDVMQVVGSVHTASGCPSRVVDLLIPVTDAGIGRGELAKDPGKMPKKTTQSQR